MALAFGWAAGSGIWNSQDTDVPATLGSQPGLLLSLIPIFGCCSHLIHIPMSTLHNLPQTLTAWELGKGKGQLMSRGRGTEGCGSGGEQEVGSPQKLPAGSTPLFHYFLPPHPPAGLVGPGSLSGGTRLAPEAPCLTPGSQSHRMWQAREGGLCVMCRREPTTVRRTLGVWLQQGL